MGHLCCIANFFQLYAGANGERMPTNSKEALACVPVGRRCYTKRRDFFATLFLNPPNGRHERKTLQNAGIFVSFKDLSNSNPKTPRMRMLAFTTSPLRELIYAYRHATA